MDRQRFKLQVRSIFNENFIGSFPYIAVQPSTNGQTISTLIP